jgi:hypothetical protein
MYVISKRLTVVGRGRAEIDIIRFPGDENDGFKKYSLIVYIVNLLTTLSTFSCIMNIALLASP